MQVVIPRFCRIEPSRALTTQFLDDMCSTFSLNYNEPNNSAVVLFGLAAVFARLSSSYGVGSERSSPYPLRFLSEACLKQMIILRPGFLSGHCEEWLLRLTGGSRASCSAILYDMMSEAARSELKNEDKQWFEKTIPACWSK